VRQVALDFFLVPLHGDQVNPIPFSPTRGRPFTSGRENRWLTRPDLRERSAIDGEKMGEVIGVTAKADQGYVMTAK
jgi:hypothetical protein